MYRKFTQFFIVISSMPACRNTSNIFLKFIAHGIAVTQILKEFVHHKNPLTNLVS